MKRVVLIGPEWHGSNSQGLADGFRAQGAVVEVLDLDTPVLPPAHSSLAGRGFYKVLRPALIRIREREVMQRSRLLRPDLVVVFKGNCLSNRLFAQLRTLAAPIVNFYPDVSMTAHSGHIKKCLPLYDAIFTTKSFGRRDFSTVFGHDMAMYYLPHGFNPRVHRPLRPSERDRRDFGADVSFVGTWSPAKERTLAFLARGAPNIRLRIWGNQWEQSTAPELKHSIEYKPVVGDFYTMTLCCTKINLALLSERRRGASQGDEITSRSFHIPATGSFMLHQRTGDFADLFEEGLDSACFGSDQELVEKTLYYLQNNNERSKIARQGFNRCIESHSLAHRAQAMLQVLGLDNDPSSNSLAHIQARRL